MLARRAGVTLIAATAGALLGAGPALADVTVSPPSVVQGSGQNLIFHVTNTGTQPLASVTLTLPSDTPVAEVYPLSVDDWAPKITMRKLNTPLPTIHGDTSTTETAGAITWLAVPGKTLASGGSADLGVAIGPLPDLSTMRFAVTSTYVGGASGPVMPPATLNLTPATAQQAAALHAGHAGHDEANTPAAGASADPEDVAFAAAVANAQRGTPIWSIAGWVVAGLALLSALGLILRNRHRAEEGDEPDDDNATVSAEPTAVTDAETVSAGKWSLRG